MKALLSNCANAAVQHDPELKAYFQRKTQEGKAKMSALNAVKAKLINRVFASINRGTGYVAFTPNRNHQAKNNFPVEDKISKFCPLLETPTEGR
jgi:hypothetical protein